MFIQNLPLKETKLHVLTHCLKVYKIVLMNAYQKAGCVLGTQ